MTTKASEHTPSPGAVKAAQAIVNHPPAALFAEDLAEIIEDCTHAGELREKLETAYGIIIWMSGSDDFGPKGQAHKGWLEQRDHLFQINSLIRKAKGEL